MEGSSAWTCQELFPNLCMWETQWEISGKEEKSTQCFQYHTEDQEQQFLIPNPMARAVLRGRQMLSKLGFPLPDVQDQSLGSNGPLCPLGFGREPWKKRNFLGQ